MDHPKQLNNYEGIGNMDQRAQKQRWIYGGKNNLAFLLFGVFFLIWIFFLHGLPLSLDDYGFLGTSFVSNSEALQWVLGFGNGRLLGNGGIVFLLHHPKTGVVVRPLVLAGIAVLLPAVLRVRRNIGSLFTMLLIMMIAPGVFGQSISWMSGFQNYVPPVFLFLAGTYIVLHSGKNGKVCMVLCAAAVMIGVAMQLYIEHSSCLNLLMAVLLVGYVWKKQRQRSCRITALCFSLGAILGFAAMLLITGRSTVGHVSYLSGGFSALLHGLMRNAVEIMGMLAENAALLLCLAGLLLVLIKRFQKDFTVMEMKASVLGLILPAVFFCGRLFIGFRSWYGKLIPAETVFTLFFMLLWTASVSFVIIRLCKKEKSKRVLACLVLFVLAFAGLVPLLFIWPIGYRCLFHSYVLLVACALLLLDEVMEGMESEKHRRGLVTGLCCLMCVSTLTMGAMFTDIRKMNRIREDYLSEMAGAGEKTVETFNIPSPYIYEVWNEEYEHYAVVDGHQIRLKILPADVWFRLNYYHYS